jgi:hypothetical protein
MPEINTAYEQQLIDLVSRTPSLMQALRTVRAVNLKSWAIAAGAIRSMVWDELHGFVTPSPLPDLDVVFYDDGLERLVSEADIQQRLQASMPDYQWEVVNQATVHSWLREQGMQVNPFQSLEEGIASWPETATCVGVFLDDKDQIKVIAPHGLDDLFELKLRHNTTMVPISVFEERIARKKFQTKWPNLINSNAPC